MRPAEDSLKVHHVRRNISDELFKFVFGHDEMMIELLHILYPETMKDVRIEEVRRITLKESILKGHINDLGMLVRNKLIVLVEAQSSWPRDIMHRFYVYLAETLDHLMVLGEIPNGNVNLSVGLYVIFTGDAKDRPDTMNLSDEVGITDVEMTVHFLYGKSREEGVVYDYVQMTKALTDYIKRNGKMDEDALMSVLNQCKKNDLFVDFIDQYKEELMSNLDYLFDPKYTDAQYEYQLREEGREEGIERTAIKMLEEGLSLEIISKTTSLSEEKLKSLQKEIVNDQG